MSALPALEISPLGVFEAYGIEIEYMIVDRASLNVLPIADYVLPEVSNAGRPGKDRATPEWSNELVSHVIELKNACPTKKIHELQNAFQSEVREMNRRLAKLGARLMPTAMHPWMNPPMETCLWRKSDWEIYSAYHRIFDCNTHGWANLQSVHINLPFANNEEFARLHAAIRLVLPLIPALAASSPIADGAPTGLMDYRVEVYRGNAKGVPSITGRVVPETVSSRAEYQARILAPMYRAIAPLDPDGKLQYEWLNSRGAIARFDRNAIEIRLVDVQECPQADIAIAAVIIDLVNMLYTAQSPILLAAQQSIGTDELVNILLACVQDGELAIIDHPLYLELFSYSGRHCRAGDLWRHLAERMRMAEMPHSTLWAAPLSVIFEHGPLARRILRAIGSQCERDQLEEVYRKLCNCLQEGEMFIP